MRLEWLNEDVLAMATAAGCAELAADARAMLCALAAARVGTPDERPGDRRLAAISGLALVSSPGHNGAERLGSHEGTNAD